MPNLALLCLSLGARQAKAKHCTLDQTWLNSALMTSFDLESVHPRSRNFTRKVLMRALPPRFVFLAFLGAEIAGGQQRPLQGA